jgi:hypothetical protein
MKTVPVVRLYAADKVINNLQKYGHLGKVGILLFAVGSRVKNLYLQF